MDIEENSVKNGIAGEEYMTIGEESVTISDKKACDLVMQYERIQRNKEKRHYFGPQKG